MLSNILTLPLKTMSLGIRDHAKLNRLNSERVAQALRDGQWSCHICSTHIPEFMEIDHLDGHTVSAKNIKPICQFCHNLKHPLWAAARGKISLIYAPDLSQAELHRICWSVIGYRREKDFPADMHRIEQDILKRRGLAEDIIYSRTTEGFLEAIFSLEEKIGLENARMTVEKLDQILRFIPSEVLPGHEALPAASRVSIWSFGGFRTAVETGADLFRKGNPADTKKLKTAASRALEATRKKV